MDDPEDEGTNGFSDWETLPFPQNHRNNHHSSADHHSFPPRTTHHRHHNHHDNHHHFSVFPPSNHEGLPIPPPPPPHAPLTLSTFNSDSDSPSPSSTTPPPKPPNSVLINKWVDFVLHLWNSKLRSCIALVFSRGFFFTVFPAASTVWILGFLWFWVRRRRQRLRIHGGNESVERLKAVIKEKDEKIIQLLEQIALMNKVLLARYKIPVLRSC